MLRSQSQNKAIHALIGDFARSWHHEGVYLTSAEWKIVLCGYFEAALAESDGRPVSDIPLPEKTSRMDVSRADCFIEFMLWLGCNMGVSFSDLS